MTDDRLIPLELTLDDLCWLRAFLNQELSAAEDDRQNVKGLHTSLATRAAVQVLSREIETMSEIHAAIDKTINIVDRRESLSKQIAAMTPPVA